MSSHLDYWFAPAGEGDGGYEVKPWAGDTVLHVFPAPTAAEKQAVNEAMATAPIPARPITAPRPSIFRRTPNQDSFPTPTR